jgi:membrane-bound serine protease (ClpP class)
MDQPILILAYLLILVGLLLMAAELFVPSHGAFILLALIAIVSGIVMTFYYRSDATLGVLTLLGVFVAVPSLAAFLFHIWPKTPLGKRFFLNGPDEDATIASMPVNIELEQLRGRFGRTVSSLRPGGVTDFDGKRVDTITEGMMVEPGQWVRCIDVKAGRVIVRPAQKPDLGDLETAIFS